MTRHGPAGEVLRLEEHPTPSPQPDEVRVAVKAAGLAFADLLALADHYPDMPGPPFVMGRELAGEIESVGSDVEHLEPGQRVIGAVECGAFAQFAVTRAENVVPLPEAMSFDQGAALPSNYATAYAIVVRLGRVQANESVLLHAAAGGVGIACVQLMLQRRARIIGTASPQKHDFLKELGVADVIDYRAQDVSTEVRRMTSGQGVDVVLDSLGRLRESYDLLRPGGRLVLYGMSELVAGDGDVASAIKKIGTSPRLNAIRLVTESKSVIGFNLIHWWTPGRLRELIDPVVDLARDGVLEPVIAKTFPLEDAAEAFRFLQERRNIGKVVLSV